MKQKQNIILIKKIFKEHFKDAKIRFIKIHGSQYQEAGLPDLMVLIHDFYRDRPLKFWLEIKRDWDDGPSELQRYNVESLRWYGFHAGYIAGDEFKEGWDYGPVPLEEHLKKI